MLSQSRHTVELVQLTQPGIAYEQSTQLVSPTSVYVGSQGQLDPEGLRKDVVGEGQAEQALLSCPAVQVSQE